MIKEGKKYLNIPVFVIMMLFSLLLVSQTVTLTLANNCVTADLIKIPAGSDQSSIGISDGLGGSEDFPHSIFVQDNVFYILDTMNKKIVIYDEQGYVRSISVDFTVAPEDILIKDNHIYVLDDRVESKVYELNEKDELVCTYKVNIPDFDPTKTAIKWLSISRNNKVAVVTSDYREYEIDSATKGVVECSPGISSPFSDKIYYGKLIDDKSRALVSTDNELFVSQKVYCKPAGLEIIGFDKDENIYVNVGDLANTSKVILESTIRKISPNGEILGIGRLPYEDGLCQSTAIHITPEGTIHYMVVKKNGVEIRVLDLKDCYDSTIKEKEIEQKRIENKESETNVKSSNTKSVSRQTANDRAYDIHALSWYYSSSNAANPGGHVSRPDWLTSYGWKTGIPYCWGGYDSLNTHSGGASWTDYEDAIDNNVYAGNVSCSSEWGYQSGTAGLDCAGYVSACLGYSSHKNTVYLWNNSVGPIASPTWMDIYINKYKHVLFYLSTNSDGTGINSVEATTSGYDKCKIYSRTFSWLNNNNYQLRTPNVYL